MLKQLEIFLNLMTCFIYFCWSVFDLLIVRGKLENRPLWMIDLKRIHVWHIWGSIGIGYLS